MRKKIITLAALTTLALTTTACTNSDEKSIEVGNDSSVLAEETKTENTKETGDSNSEINLEEKNKRFLSLIYYSELWDTALHITDKLPTEKKTMN